MKVLHLSHYCPRRLPQCMLIRVINVNFKIINKIFTEQKSLPLFIKYLPILSFKMYDPGTAILKFLPHGLVSFSKHHDLIINISLIINEICLYNYNVIFIFVVNLTWSFKKAIKAKKVFNSIEFT